MGFFDALQRTLGGGSPPEKTLREIKAEELGIDPDDLPLPEGAPFNAGNYDRDQWSKKLKRLLGGLPGTQGEWDDLVAESKALGFEPDWVAMRSRQAFAMLVRKIVADRVVTESEHRTLDLARELIGLTDAEAEIVLDTVVAEAESLFGESVEGV